jgi:hypothetical protein
MAQPRMRSHAPINGVGGAFRGSRDFVDLDVATPQDSFLHDTIVVFLGKMACV